MLRQKLGIGLLQVLNNRFAQLTLQNANKANRINNLCTQIYATSRINNRLSDIQRRCFSKSIVETENSSVAALPIEKVNHQLQNYEEGRLFATVHICGKQFKVVEGDIIIIEGYWPPDIGDKISLDKVLLAGGSDFSLIGRPLIQQGLVKVIATVIEKTLSHTKTHFRKKRRKQYQRINFYRCQHTMLRINSIEIQERVNTKQDDTKEVKIF